MEQVESEWATLKDLVKRFANGIPGHTFEWCTNDGPGCLQLRYVAATFRDGYYRILFDRRTRGGPGSRFVEDSPVPTEEWQLEPKITGSSVLWFPRRAPKLQGDFSSSQIAQEIIARLIRYDEDYTKACTLR
jgi:hypothetical protein